MTFKNNFPVTLGSLGLCSLKHVLGFFSSSYWVLIVNQALYRILPQKPSRRSHMTLSLDFKYSGHSHMTRHLKAGLSISHPHSSSVKCHTLHVKCLLTPASSSKCQEEHEKGSQFKSSEYISRQSLQEILEDLFPSEFSPLYCSCSQNNVRTFQVSGWQRLVKMLNLACSSPPEVEGQRWWLRRRKELIATPMEEEKSTCHTHGRRAHAHPWKKRTCHTHEERVSQFPFLYCD